MNQSTTHASQYGYPGLAAALALILLYPNLSTFWHHQYPILSAEFFLLVSASLTASLLLAAVLFRTRVWIVNFALVLFLFIAFMIQFNLLLKGMAIVLIVLIIAALASRKHFVAVLIPVIAAIIVGSFLDSWSDRAANRNIAEVESVDESLAPVIHIVMDQFIGLDGLPPQQDGQQFRNTAMEFLEEFGFQVYPRAYSNYVTTQDSLDHAFNFQNNDIATEAIQYLLLKNYSFSTNKYLESLHETGYAIRIYQSEGMDFCRSLERGLEKCWTHNIPDLVSIYHGHEDPVERMRLVFRLMIAQSWILNMVAEQQGFSRPGGLSYFKSDIFGEITEDMTKNSNGRVYFAHVLFPHSPFVYLQDCSLNYDGEVQWRFSNYNQYPNNTPQSRAKRYGGYLEQSHCSFAHLGRFFDELKSKGLFERSIILIHSDHGSTIYERAPSMAHASSLTQADLLDAFSILYAVKMPDDTFQVHSDTVSLSLLINRFASKLTGKNHADLDETPFIYLGEKGGLNRQDVDIFAIGPQ